MTTAQQLIDRSISHTEIVHAAWTIELDVELERLASGFTQAEDVRDFWGETEDGEHWRVMLDDSPVGRAARVARFAADLGDHD